ncbi:MAG: ABC transporter permease [Bacteroidota bacterium]
MLANYLRVALRSLRRQKGYAAINVLGLAVGIACCLFLLLYVGDELRYDRHHEAPEEVFRIHAQFDDRELALTPPMVAGLLEEEVPAVEAAARLYATGNVVRFEDRVFEEDRFVYADASVFDVFTLPVLAGAPEAALQNPETVVLTASAAARYFGDADPVGQTLLVNNRQTFEVGGVIADLPATSHVQFDLVASFATLPETPPIWSNANHYTYVRTRGPEAAAAFPAQLAALIARLEADGQQPWALQAMPLTDIHLRSTAEYEMDRSGDLTTVYGLALVAALILLIACINYMNLATARAVRRAGEIGLRKSIGAFRGQLVRQFYAEAAVLTVIAGVLALLFVVAGLPAFNGLSGKALAASALVEPQFVLLGAGMLALVTLLAGGYPALHLSSLEPVRALRGGVRSGRGAAWFRKGLVVVQFGISAVLVIGTLVVLSQLRYLSSQDLGFDKEHLVVLPLDDGTLREAYPAIEAALDQSPAVVATAGINQVPGELGWTSQMWGEGMADDDVFYVKGLPADADVADALGLRLVAGEAFPAQPPEPDSTNHLFLINEATARQFGWTPAEAVGRSVAVDTRQGVVRGVVQDFHYRSLHEPIEPLAVWYDPGGVFNLAVRIAPGGTRAARDRIEAVWAEFAPHRPVSYRFLDDVYAQLYQGEQTFGRLVSVFAFLAVFVACLGLFGLASFTVAQRTREIGVRKVLGATVPALVGLLTKEVVALVAVAFAVAAPVAYLGVGRWLDGFASRIDLGPGVFALAGLGVLAIALLTVSGQALRAATADPVRSLRSD